MCLNIHCIRRCSGFAYFSCGWTSTVAAEVYGRTMKAAINVISPSPDIVAYLTLPQCEKIVLPLLALPNFGGLQD